MFKRQGSYRVVSAIVIIIALAAIGFASGWGGNFSALNPFAATSSEAAPASTTGAPVLRPMTIGVCDTAGPIEVEGSILGTTPTAYATLTAAFAAINAGTHTGAVSVEVCGDTNEGTGTALLNASGTGSSSYTQIVMRPVGGVARTITGATTAGSPLIDFSGADNVTINGQNTGGDTLTIANTTVSATSGTSTIRFVGGATGNTITNSNIQGSNSASVATNGAVIFFSTDAVTANGNDNNTISNNNIGPAGTNLPTKAILCNGSTTTTAIGNSGLVINNNNIFDYYGAAVTSAGVAVNGGCNTFSITNNRFYQTATRTQTTAALHTAINMNSSTATSGVQGMTITGNTIGYASNTQTGTYTLTGAVASTFRGISFTGITLGTVSNIDNNTIASISMTGVTSSGTSSSSPFMGIYVSNGVTTASSNTIGSQSATGSISYSSSSASATDVIGMFNFGSDAWTTNNNLIGGITGANTSTGATNVYGLRANTSSSVTWTATGNTIGGTIANSIQSTTTATGTTVQGFLDTSPALTFTGNTVRNLTAAGGTGTTTAAAVIGVTVAASSANHTVGQNTIFNLSASNTSAASVVTGIQYTATSGTNIVERNLIYNLLAPTTSTSAEINGIRVSGGTTTYRNNMIALGANQAIAIGSAATNSSTTAINGINEPLGTDNFYHNSVYIGGTATSGSGASFAFNGTQTVNTRAFRDNIFQNARTNSGATGTHYAVKINGTAANPTGLTINNNVYFANGASGAKFGFFNSLDVANLAAWKTAVGQDAGSFESNPQYNDPTNATPDLHLHPTNATVAEGNGADVGVTNDYDGQTRASLTPVDIGADAGNFTGIDLSAPSISYTTLANTTLTTDRILSPVTMTDTTGVDTGANAPRIYYKKNAGAYFSQACTLSSGTVTNGQWSCTIVAADMGGLAVADVVSYFVIAQDTVGNVGSNPSAGLAATNVNTVTTPPTTPNTYTIAAGISGTKTVCSSGCDYTGLTTAGGVFADINGKVVTGNLTINITGDLTTETGAVALNQTSEEPSGSNFTITIKASGGAARTISGTSASGLITLNGADRVTFDGSTNTFADPGGDTTKDSPDSPNAAGNNLTITNTNTGTSSAVIWVQTAAGSNGATNNTFKNLNITGQANTTTLAGIGFGSSTVSITSLGTGNNNNTVQACDIQKTQLGIYSQGANAAAKNTGNVFTQNLINAVSPNNVQIGGIMVGFEDNITISRNNIANMSRTSSVFGISAGFVTEDFSATTFTGNEVTNATITRNFVDNVTSTSATGFSGMGIAYASAATGTTLIANNMITRVSDLATSPDFNAGIYVGGGAGSLQIYNNSVWLSGNRGAATLPSFALAIGGATPIVDIRNNALENTSVSTGAGKSYAIGLAYTSTLGNYTNLTSNYNDFFVSGTSGVLTKVGSLTQASGTDKTPLSAWTTETGRDTPNSISLDPAFTSSSNLHITGAPLQDVGQTIAAVTNDIDGTTRPQGTGYEIGAHEIIAAPGVLQFSSANFSGPEGGNVVLTVSRTSGSAGTVGATVTLADGTGAIGGASCTAGIDFINPGPQLVSLGDTVSSTTLNVAACSDGVFDPGETFTATLSAPTGGATLGAQTTTTGTIIDVAPPFSGSYNVGTAQNYTSLTNSGGIFEAINNSGVTGNVTINITSDLTAETGTVALNAFASPFTVTIQPSGAARIVSGAAASTALIRLNGASRVTFDGSVGGGGTDRSLTITNTSTTSPSVVRFGSIGTTPIVNDTVKNCIIINGVNTSSAVTLLDTAGSTAGYFNNVTIQNNDIRTAFVGVFANAIVAAGNGSGTAFTGNKLDNSGATAIRNVGLYMQGVDGGTISGNTVGNFNAADSESDTGIWLATGTVNTTISGNTVSNLGMTSTTSASVAPYGIRDSGGTAASGNSITGNTVTNITANTSGTSGSTSPVIGIDTSSGGTLILRNNVSGIIHNSTGTYGAYGISVTAGNNVVIRNNFVSNVNHDMTGGIAFSPTYAPTGIRILAGTGHQIYYNSVNLYGPQTGTANSSLLSAAISIVSTTSTGMDIRNNIFANNITGGTTSIAHVSAYLPSGGTSAMNLTWNNNSYYYGTDSARQGIGQAGTTAGTNFYTTLATMAAYTSTLSVAATNDNASIASTGAVPFVAANDLHITTTAPELSIGVPITGVTVDYDTDPRPASNTDIGADQIVRATGGVVPAGTFYNASFVNGDTLAGNVKVTNTLYLNGISDAGSNTVTIGCNGTTSGGGASSYMVGAMSKDYCAPQSFTYPVGTAADGSRPDGNLLPPPEYSPFTANVTSGTFPANLKVSVVDAVLAGSTALNSASRYWDVTQSGPMTADISFIYLDQDVPGGAIESSFQVLRRSGGVTAVYAGGSVNPATNTGTAPGVSAFSQWAAGNLLPTAANDLTMAGRVTTADGRGIRNATVVVTGGNLTQPMFAQSGSLGWYSFNGLQAGQTYIVSVSTKRFVFSNPSRVVSLSDNLTDVDFVADP